MTYIDQGTQGAFRQTWRKGNPRALLKTLLEKNPKADATAIYKYFGKKFRTTKIWCAILPAIGSTTIIIR